MEDDTSAQSRKPGAKLAVDIGSTVIKIAEISASRKLLEQSFHSRDFDRNIAEQLEMILSSEYSGFDPLDLLICSSANGGLRIGIVSLTSRYSGAILRNQALLAGANPLYVQTLSQLTADPTNVDVLLIGGGIDCRDVGPAQDLLRAFPVDDFNFGTLIFAGNKHLAGEFSRKYPNTHIISNPITGALDHPDDSVFRALRDAYLDDLVYKKGISEVAAKYPCHIRPTPEVVNRGFELSISNKARYEAIGANILVDIGGATTDLHYTTEIIPDDSEDRPPTGTSIGRYVYTDLGIVASLDSTVIRLRNHSRLYEFLSIILDAPIDETYRALREGDYEITPDTLAYACVFLALDRFSIGDGPGLPQANLARVDRIVLTGGAAQLLDESKVAEIIRMIANKPGECCAVVIDRDYGIWVDGIIGHGIN